MGKITGSARGQAREVQMRAVVHRADGTVEDLGVIAYWHRNPLRRWAWKLKRIFKRGTP